LPISYKKLEDVFELLKLADMEEFVKTRKLFYKINQVKSQPDADTILDRISD
jgi:hypothetical protein